MTHTVDDAVRDYLALRDGITEINREVKGRVAELKATQERIADFIEQQRVAVGVESFRTAHGTAFRQEWKAVKVSDWSAFLQWLLATGNYHMLTKAVSKEAVMEFMAETKTIPPGLSYDHGYELRVNRGNK